MNRPRILVVDDEKQIRESYKMILKKEDLSKSIEDRAAALFSSQEEEGETSLDDLLGDDEGYMIIEEELGTGNFEIVEASNGLDAVSLVEQSLAEKNPFCMVFMDVRMPPGIDGVEAASRIRKLDPDIEIVIMTAYSDYDVDEIIEKVGNPDRLLYFHKPFQSEQIKSLACSLTKHWYLEKKRREQD